MAAPGAVLARIVSVNVGSVGERRGPDGRRYRSAIVKHPVPGAVAVHALGLAGDEQADRVAHGGPDKAVHAHFRQHLELWSLGPGDIGENLTLAGGDEAAFCVGDRLAAGSAELEVSQPRIPCFKQSDRSGVPLAAIRASGRTGFYLRVLRPGTLAAGDGLVLLARPHPEVSLALVNRVLHVAPGDAAARARVLACPELAAALRARLAARR
jgi:MOSC domain-containing protein YiiM